jgi:hypothetical protein
MMIRWLSGAALAAAILIGCDVDAPPDAPAGPLPDPRATAGSPMGAPEELRPVQSVVVRLDPVEGSGFSGQATLTPGDTTTQVRIELRGTRAGASHAARIYAGPCDDPGALISQLDPILAAGPTVVVEQTVRQPPLIIFAGQTSLMIYRPGGVVAGPGAACGDIPRQAGLAPEPAGIVTQQPVIPAEPPVTPRNEP